METEALKAARATCKNVFYGKPGLIVRATVESVHKDETTTVLARFFLNEKGENMPGYLGYRYRVANSYLRAAA